MRIVLSLLFVLLLAGCGVDGGSASCEEACTSDNDCQAGLKCYSLVGYDTDVCFPDDCQPCFDQGKTCRWHENTEEQEQGFARKCEFNECGF